QKETKSTASSSGAWRIRHPPYPRSRCQVGTKWARANCIPASRSLTGPHRVILRCNSPPRPASRSDMIARASPAPSPASCGGGGTHVHVGHLGIGGGAPHVGPTRLMAHHLLALSLRGARPAELGA